MRAVMDHMPFVIEIDGARLLSVWINDHQIIVSICGAISSSGIFRVILTNDDFMIEIELERKPAGSVPRLPAAFPHPFANQKLPP